MLAKSLSCNYLWSRAFKVITEGFLQNKPSCEGFIFLLSTSTGLFQWLPPKSTFQQKVSHPYIFYVFVVLTCKVPFLFMSERAYATQRAPHTAVISPWVCTLSGSKVVVLMHWHDIKANLNAPWLSLESDDDLSSASHQQWERLQCTAVWGLHPFDMLTQ